MSSETTDKTKYFCFYQLRFFYEDFLLFEGKIQHRLVDLGELLKISAISGAVCSSLKVQRRENL